ncbi:hypothetical protein MNBD_ALPHA06-1320 [hydrothermal vent metagenome]|uniref:SAF domain-containing protein n=1 Tax=hydrothermal vent metagenome TaxID=652676 RepID=A0A3B0S3Z3_9ZZZZ
MNAGEQAGIIIVAAPLPGRRLMLNSAVLAQIARGNGRFWKNSAQLDRILVKRIGHRLGRMELSTLLQTELKRLGENTEYEMIIRTGATSVYVPNDAVEPPFVDRLDVNPATGVFTASLTPYPGAAQVNLRGRAWPLVKVPALKNGIAIGHIITSKDIVWVSVRADRLGSHPVLNEDDLVGKASRRSLTAKRILRVGDIKIPDTVVKGELISILYEAPGLKLTAKGRVLSSAHLGDIVRAVNLHSHQTIDVIITGHGTAMAVSTIIAGG